MYTDKRWHNFTMGGHKNFIHGDYYEDIPHALWAKCPSLGKMGHRSRSYGHLMHTAKICLNSIPGDPINFILGC